LTESEDDNSEWDSVDCLSVVNVFDDNDDDDVGDEIFSELCGFECVNEGMRNILSCYPSLICGTGVKTMSVKGSPSESEATYRQLRYAANLHQLTLSGTYPTQVVCSKRWIQGDVLFGFGFLSKHRSSTMSLQISEETFFEFESQTTDAISGNILSRCSRSRTLSECNIQVKSYTTSELTFVALVDIFPQQQIVLHETAEFEVFRIRRCLSCLKLLYQAEYVPTNRTTVLNSIHFVSSHWYHLDNSLLLHSAKMSAEIIRTIGETLRVVDRVNEEHGCSEDFPMNHFSYKVWCDVFGYNGGTDCTGEFKYFADYCRLFATAVKTTVQTELLCGSLTSALYGNTTEYLAIQSFDEHSFDSCSAGKYHSIHTFICLAV
jgi:hypothetical protein